jgi:hypothetical protein
VSCRTRPAVNGGCPNCSPTARTILHLSRVGTCDRKCVGSSATSSMSSLGEPRSPSCGPTCTL